MGSRKPSACNGWLGISVEHIKRNPISPLDREIAHASGGDKFLDCSELGKVKDSSFEVDGFSRWWSMDYYVQRRSHWNDPDAQCKEGQIRTMLDSSKDKQSLDLIDPLSEEAYGWAMFCGYSMAGNKEFLDGYFRDSNVMGYLNKLVSRIDAVGATANPIILSLAAREILKLQGYNLGNAVLKPYHLSPTDIGNVTHDTRGTSRSGEADESEDWLKNYSVGKVFRGIFERRDEFPSRAVINALAFFEHISKPPKEYVDKILPMADPNIERDKDVREQVSSNVCRWLRMGFRTQEIRDCVLRGLRGDYEPSSEVRKNYILATQWLGDSVISMPVMASLLSALRDDNFEIRKGAVVAISEIASVHGRIGVLADDTFVESLMEEFERLLTAEADPYMLRELAIGIRKFPPEACRESIILRLGDILLGNSGPDPKNSDLRAEAAKTLSELCKCRSFTDRIVAIMRKGRLKEGNWHVLETMDSTISSYGGDGKIANGGPRDIGEALKLIESADRDVRVKGYDYLKEHFRNNKGPADHKIAVKKLFVILGFEYSEGGKISLLAEIPSIYYKAGIDLDMLFAIQILSEAREPDVRMALRRTLAYDLHDLYDYNIMWNYDVNRCLIVGRCFDNSVLSDGEKPEAMGLLRALFKKFYKRNYPVSGLGIIDAIFQLDSDDADVRADLDAQKVAFVREAFGMEYGSPLMIGEVKSRIIANLKKAGIETGRLLPVLNLVLVENIMDNDAAEELIGIYSHRVKDPQDLSDADGAAIGYLRILHDEVAVRLQDSIEKEGPSHRSSMYYSFLMNEIGRTVFSLSEYPDVAALKGYVEMLRCLAKTMPEYVVAIIKKDKLISDPDRIDLIKSVLAKENHGADDSTCVAAAEILIGIAASGEDVAGAAVLKLASSGDTRLPVRTMAVAELGKAGMYTSAEANEILRDNVANPEIEIAKAAAAALRNRMFGGDELAGRIVEELSKDDSLPGEVRQILIQGTTYIISQSNNLTSVEKAEKFGEIAIKEGNTAAACALTELADAAKNYDEAAVNKLAALSKGLKGDAVKKALCDKATGEVSQAYIAFLTQRKNEGIALSRKELNCIIDELTLFSSPLPDIDVMLWLMTVHDMNGKSRDRAEILIGRVMNSENIQKVIDAIVSTARPDVRASLILSIGRANIGDGVKKKIGNTIMSVLLGSEVPAVAEWRAISQILTSDDVYNYLYDRCSSIQEDDLQIRNFAVAVGVLRRPDFFKELMDLYGAAAVGVETKRYIISALAALDEAMKMRGVDVFVELEGRYPSHDRNAFAELYGGAVDVVTGWGDEAAADALRKRIAMLKK